MTSFKTLILAPLIVSLATTLAGCKEVSQTAPADIRKPATAPTSSEVSSKKFGAAVVFSHSYDGRSDIDQVEHFELTFQPTQAIDTLTIDLSSPDNILLEGDRSLTRAASANSAVTVPVSIMANTEGKFYLNILVQTEQNGRRLGRAFAVAIHVGDSAAAQKTNAQNEDNVHVMPAQEEIR